jgi:hypothetical protein
MKRIYVSLLALLLLVSCNQKERSFVELFTASENLVPEESILDRDSILNPYMIQCTEQGVLLANMFQPNFLNLFDGETGELKGTFLTRGSGPGECMHLSTMCSRDSSLFLWDAMRSSFSFASIQNDSLSHESGDFIPLKYDDVLKSVFQLYPLNRHYLVASGIIKGGRFAIINDKGELVSTFGEYSEEYASMEEVTKAMLNQCVFAYQQEKKVLAVANGMGENISFYDMSNLKSPRLIKSYTYRSPSYELDGDGSVVYQKNNIVGFVDLLASKDYCVGFFLGDTLKSPTDFGADKLLYFDWDGTPKEIRMLDRIYMHAALSPTADRLYFLGKGKESGEFMVYQTDFAQ